MKKAIGLLVLLMFAVAVINSCGGGGGGGGAPAGDPGGGGGGGGTGTTTTVSGAVRLSSTLGKPGIAKSGIFGALMSAPTGTPLDNATVELYDADRPEWVKPVASAQTGATGNYTLNALTNSTLNTGATYTDGNPIPAGNYTLIAYKLDIDTGKIYLAVQGFVKYFTGDVTGQDLETQDDSTVPVVESMFGLLANTDGTFGSSSYSLPSNAAVQLTFNTTMARKTLVDALTIVDNASAAVPGTWKVSADLQSATFYPTSPLTDGTVYTVTLAGGADTNTARSLFRVPMSDRVNGTFVGAVADTTPPTAIKISPATSTDVLVDTPIQIASNDPLDLNTFAVASTPSIGDKPAIKYAGLTDRTDEYKYAYTIVPVAQMTPNTDYTIGVSGTKDLAGNTLNTLSFSFKTESDTAAPTVLASSVTPTGANVAVAAVVKAKFAATIDPTTVTNASVLVTQGTSTGAAVAGTLVFKNNQITFTPSASLSYSTPYTVVITTGVKNLWGIAMAADYSWSFTTAAPPDFDAPTTTASPAGGTYGSAQSVTLTANEAATIYYTITGADPTTASATYSGPINVSSTTTLKFFAKDTAGNSETVKTEVYAIDAAAPVTTASPAAGTYNTEQSITLTANKAGSSIYFTTDVSAPTASFALYSGASITVQANAATTLRYFAKDALNNTETVKASIYVIDTTPPSGSISIAGGAPITTTGAVTLTLSASDNLTNVTQMSISNDNFVSSVTGTYAISSSWNLLATQGTATVYVKFKDGAGNWSLPVTDTIVLDSVMPTAIMTKPTNTTSAPFGNIEVTFSEDMDPFYVQTSLNFFVKQGGVDVLGSINYDAVTKVVTFTPFSSMAYSTIYTVTVKSAVRDLAGNTMVGDYVASFTTEAAPAVPTTTASPGAGYYMYTSMTVTLVTSAPTATIYFTTDNSDPMVSGTRTTVTGGTAAVLLSSGSTTLKFYSVLTGAPGTEPVQALVYVLDTVGPTGTITVSGSSGAAATNTTSVTLTLSATDTISGVDQMRFSNDGGATWSAYQAYATTKAWTMTAGDSNAKYVYVQFKDRTGNQSVVYSDSIILDTVAPVLTGCNVNNNAIAATSQSVNFYRTVTDAAPTSGVTEMRFWNGSAWPATWSALGSLTYNAATLLSSSNGFQYVDYQVRDAAGNTAYCYDGIYYDTTPPTPGSITLYGTVLNPATGATAANTTASRSTAAYTYLYPADTGSYITEYQLSVDGGATWGAATAYTTSGQRADFTLPSGSGAKTVAVRFKDAANYWSSTNATDTITLDTAVPTGSAYINNNAVYTNSTSVTLNMSATDANTSVTQIRPYVLDGAWVDYGVLSYVTSKIVTLPAGDGTKTAGAYFYDYVGNQSAWYSDTITLDQTRPAISGMSPGCGSSISRSGQSFYIYFNEANEIDPATVTASTFYLGSVSSSIAYNISVGTNSVRLTPNSTLSVLTTYYLYMTSAVKDKAGNTLSNPLSGCMYMTPLF